MRRLLALLGVALAIAAVPGSTEARGYGSRGGTVMTPFGPVYNTNSPEWRAAGGNPLVYEQIMEQKMLMMQEQQMIRQQQMYLKQQQQQAKTKGSKTGLSPSTGNSSFAEPVTLPTKKKKHTATTTKSAAKPAGKPSTTGTSTPTTSTTTAKPATSSTSPSTTSAPTTTTKP